MKNYNELVNNKLEFVESTIKLSFLKLLTCQVKKLKTTDFVNALLIPSHGHRAQIRIGTHIFGHL